MIWEVENLNRYRTLNRLTRELDSIISKGVNWQFKNVIDKTRLKNSRIFITKAWKNTINSYKTRGWILDMKDTSGIDSAKNNADGNNTYAKTDFNIYNVDGANAGITAGDISIISEEISNNKNNTDIS